MNLQYLTNYWKNNKLILTMGLIAYFLLILSYTVIISLQSRDGFLYAFLSIGSILFITFFLSLITVNQLLKKLMSESKSRRRSISIGVTGGLLTALLTTLIICFLIIFYEAGFKKYDIKNFIEAVAVYTFIASLAPSILGIIFGGIYGFLNYNLKTKVTNKVIGYEQK